MILEHFDNFADWSNIVLRALANILLRWSHLHFFLVLTHYLYLLDFHFTVQDIFILRNLFVLHLTIGNFTQVYQIILLGSSLELFIAELSRQHFTVFEQTLHYFSILWLELAFDIGQQHH